jgi:XTP/dITP diphosphohydrolase
MRELIFATNNSHKASEIEQLMAGRFRVITLKEAGLEGDIPETEPALEGNALLKARHIHALTGRDCFADDTGLEVAALGGRPGVMSARYAGPACEAEANMNLLLRELTDATDRGARFRTVIALILDGKEHLFEGIAEGSIISEKRGEEGFGYDPIFIPIGCDMTFAEMSKQEKNLLSHRGKAIRQLILFLGSIG